MSEELSGIEIDYFSREKIVFDFDDFLKHPSTRKVFFSFLAEIFVPEYDMFLERLGELKMLETIDEAMPLVQEIIRNFVENNAPHLLNISAGMQTQCLEQYSNLIEKFEEQPKSPTKTAKRASIFISDVDETEIFVGRPKPVIKDGITVTECKVIFTRIEAYVYQMLKEDVFPRFIRSNTFSKWYQAITSQKNKTEASSILRQVSYLKSDGLKAKKQIFFDECEFMSPINPISRKELEFYSQLREDSDHWEMLEAFNDGAAGYWTKVPFVTSVTSKKNPNYSTFKYVSYLPFDLATCALALCTRLEKTDPNSFAITFRQFVPDKDIPSTACTSVVTFGNLFQKRLLNDVLSATYDPKENEIGMYLKSCVDPTVYPKVKNTSLMTGIAGYFLKGIDEKRTKFVNVIMNNSHGIVQKMSSGPLFKKILKDRRRILYKVFVEQCEQLQKNNELKDGYPGYFYHDDKFGLIRCLEQYCKQHLKPEEYPKFINQQNQKTPFYPNC